MKVIREESSFKSVAPPVITLGNFDGIHLGHQKILASVIKRARLLGAPSLVYTFDPHPLKVVAPHKSPPLILALEDKVALIESAGIDYLVLARFTQELAATATEEFAGQVIVGRLNAVEVLVGENFSFGRGRSGGVKRLKELGEEMGFTVHAVAPCTRGGQMVSSSRIRNLIKNGKVKEAASLLARPFFIVGQVVSGDALGRTLGFPTANIEPRSELIPGNGVYAVIATLGQRRFRAMVNIGTGPTFKGKSLKIEAHLLGFNGDLYGKDIEVAFIARLREERAFCDGEALIRQIKLDREAAEKILGDVKLYDDNS